MALTAFGGGVPRALRAALLALACLSLGTWSRVQAQASPTNEYQLKAVFLFNFAQFVEWPPSAFPTPDAPLVIGVLGDDPFGDYLDETVRGETVNGHPLMVQRFRRVEDISTCHILFVARTDNPHLEQVLDSLRARNILTVGDFEGFAGRGGMIRFVTDHNHIRLRINLAVAEAANLQLSSKLLRPATIVSTGKD